MSAQVAFQFCGNCLWGRIGEIELQEAERSACVRGRHMLARGRRKAEENAVFLEF